MCNTTIRLDPVFKKKVWLIKDTLSDPGDPMQNPRAHMVEKTDS